MERAVRGATKPKSAPPKEKYLLVLLQGTSNDASLREIFVALRHRMREQSWTIVFKSLIVIHILMRRGSGDNVTAIFGRDPNLMNVASFRGSSHPEQTKNIHAYAAYLEEKVATYRDLKVDFVKTHSKPGAVSRLRKLTVSKGVLREVKVVQRQIGALLKSKFFLDEVDNEVTLTALQLLVQDLLALFQVVNEGVINILEQFFEMSHVDAEDALQIYRTFVKQTEGVVSYLGLAKNFKAALKISIPNLKHAPISLTAYLEDYVNDPNFENNREEYKKSKYEKSNSSKKEVKHNNLESKSSTKSTSSVAKQSVADEGSKVKDTTTATKAQIKERGDLIDFFSSIEQEQILIFGNQYGTGSIGHSATNPFILLQQQQDQQALLQQQMGQLTLQQQALQPISATTDTNPFRSFVQSSSSTNPILPLAQSPTLGTSTTQSAYNPFQPQISQSSLTPSVMTPGNPFTGINTNNQVSASTTPILQQTTSLDSNPFRRLSTVPSFDSLQVRKSATFPSLMPQSDISSQNVTTPFHQALISQTQFHQQRQQSTGDVFGGL